MKPWMYSTISHLRLYVSVVALVVTFGALIIAGRSALASNVWHTVERVNGSPIIDVPFPKINSEGRYVVFQSSIANLVPNDSNNFCDTDRDGVANNSCADIFVYDRETKSTTMMSISSDGIQSNQQSSLPSISPDARYITFQSQASNLVPDGVHKCVYFRALLRQCTDIFVHNRETGTTERVSVGYNSTKANGNSNFPSISADGRHVAFSSEASNLIPDGIHICSDSFSSGQCTHIFVHDHQTGTNTRVSVTSNGERGNYGSYQPIISADGRHVAFLSSASNLVQNDNNGRFDVFVRHLDTEQTVLASIASDGTQANQDAEFIAPAINENGRYVAFVSRSTNLVANDTNGVADVFVHDLQTGSTVRASIATDGSQANIGSGSYSPSLSSDGRYVLFDSWATNLVPGDTNGQPDIFVRDLQSATTTRVSMTQDGFQANKGSYAGTISPDGKFASFSSVASNLTPDDSNNAPDMFVAEASNIPTFPYFSQKDSAWGNQEYDSANTYGPFFCGTTIGGCGCAITSSAMLLKYYGVDKAPNGDTTNPATLNNWLKANNGYAFGALKWNSIASYSVKANAAYGTQKIRFVGVGAGNNSTILNQDLSNNSPPILEEPGHFIVATGQQSPTYTINDPAWENRKTLTAYSNQFLSMRRYEKTNTDLSTIYISAPAPTSIFITDSSGKKAGKNPQTGVVYNEISGSFYYLDPTLVNDEQENPLQPPEGSGVQTLAIVNLPAGPYNIQIYNPNGNNQAEFSVYDRNGDISVQNLDQQTFSDQPINFEMNYSPEPGAKIDLTQKIKIDIKPGSDTNPVNLKSNGVIPVAAITETTFDAAQTNLSDLTFGPSGAKEIHNKIHLEDFGNDDDLDAILHFRTNAIGITETTGELCLLGKTLNGTKFKGCDNITITP